MKEIWKANNEVAFLYTPDPFFVRAIAQHFKITDITARIIANREMKTLQEVTAYLHPSLKNIPDPFLFRDMTKITKRIFKAIKKQEMILIYGDYDVDGITSAALLFKFFQHIACPAKFYIPDRFVDGYGLNLERLMKIREDFPYNLLITVDCGIANEEIIHKLSRYGIDTIVTDHHRVDTKPMSAFGVLNPSIPECPFPFKELAGVGVVFFLLIGLRKYLRDRNFWNDQKHSEPDLRRFLDIVSLGTIADMVPLKGINRILTKYGLNLLPNTSHTGLRNLLNYLNLNAKKDISPWEVSFQIAPRLNAAGRIEKGNLGITLLVSSDEHETHLIASKLEALNRERQRIERNLIETAINAIRKGNAFMSPYAIVLWGEKWHEGVIGIVASKLVERYARPVALISLQGEVGKGSLRGVHGLNVFEALKKSKDWLLSFGGHQMAGGITIERKKLTRFAHAFSEAIKSQSPHSLPARQWYVDAMINGSGALPSKFFSELRLLEPFGFGNSPPLIGFSEFQVLSKRLMQNKHIRFTFRLGKGSPLQAIAFNAKEYFNDLEKIEIFLGIPTINRWNGHESPQIIIRKFLN